MRPLLHGIHEVLKQLNDKKSVGGLVLIRANFKLTPKKAVQFHLKSRNFESYVRSLLSQTGLAWFGWILLSEPCLASCHARWDQRYVIEAKPWVLLWTGSRKLKNPVVQSQDQSEADLSVLCFVSVTFRPSVDEFRWLPFVRKEEQCFLKLKYVWSCNNFQSKQGIYVGLQVTAIYSKLISPLA